MATSMLMSKFMSLSDARNILRSTGGQVMSQSAERRIQNRRKSSERLFVQITACVEQDMVGATFSCTAQDVSATGLRILCEAPIPNGSKLDLWVDSRLRPGKYFLTSDVRWTQEEKNGECSIGIELLDSPTTDFQQWRQDNAA